MKGTLSKGVSGVNVLKLSHRRIAAVRQENLVTHNTP